MIGKKKLRIAFGSIFYPLMMGRYMLEALLRRSDTEIWTYGPYTGDWIPWAGGMRLPKKYVFKPDKALPFGQPPSIRYGQMEMEKPWQPDLWIEVNGGLQTFGRPAHGPYAIIASDPHVLGGIYDVVRPKADFFFGMQKPYLKPGDIWLPYGYDPIWHAPSTIPMADRAYDAALIGLQYGNRIHLTDKLRAMGKNVFFELGPVYDDAREIYHNTRVGFNWSSKQDTTARVFELMAMGCVPVLNRVPDLMEMFVDGRDFRGFDTMDEAVEIICAMSENHEAAEMAGHAAQNAVREHSWDNRMQKVLEETGVL